MSIVSGADRGQDWGHDRGQAGFKGKHFKDLTGTIAFEIACMVDDTAGLEFDGVTSNPYLAFVNDDNSDEIIHLDGNSYCHEIVYGILNAISPDEENT